MHEIQAIILGIVQGITEFIPISSSAHLAILHKLFGWTDNSITIDAALHLGTLFALLAYFWRDWYAILKDHLGSRKAVKGIKSDVNSALLWPIVIASIPAAIAGVILDKKAEAVFVRSPLLIACTLIVMGIVLLLADRIGKKTRPIGKLTVKDCIVIGLAQTLALVPGVSRSGITITAGLLCGLEREAAAKFSFFIGAPIILGAALFELRHVVKGEIASSELLSLALGIVAAAVVGYACIGFLMQYLKKRSTDIFVAYRVVFGIAIFALFFLGYLNK